MGYFGKSIHSIIPKDIYSLIDNKTEETWNLEYKETLPGNSNGDRKEFLADITSFANKEGGTIIYGIEEERDKTGKSTGRPKKINDLGEINIDEVKQKYESIILSRTEPKLNVELEITKTDDGNIMIVDVPRSLLSPHAVIHNHNRLFFIRTNSGKDQMSVDQLRQSFLQTAEWEKQANEFRERRIEELISHGYVNTSEKNVQFFMHILPIGYRSNKMDFTKIKSDLISLVGPKYGISRQEFNIDGFRLGNYGFGKYIQFFRNGNIEIFAEHPIQEIKNEKEKYRLLSGVLVQEYLCHFYDKAVEYIRFSKIEPPIIVFISFINTKDIYLTPLKRVMNVTYIDELCPGSINREQLWIPGKLIDNYSDLNKNSLYEIFDIFWQAGGYDKSPPML